MKKRAAVLLLVILLITNSGTTAMAAETPLSDDLPESSLLDGLPESPLAAGLPEGPLISGLPEVSPFTDLAVSHWSYPYAADLVRQGVVTGYPDGSFRPSNSITFGETFKLILTAIGVPEPEAQPGEHWAYPYIRLALDNLLVYSFDAGGLNEVPTRQEVARMVARALDLTDISGDSPFEDCDDGYVVKLYEKGIVEGIVERDGTRRFYPDRPFSREELVTTAWRIMNTDVSQGMFRYSNYWVDILDGVPLTSFDQEQFSREENGRVTWSGGYFARGIDVSGYKKDIDWEAVAGDGIDFAIIRAGGRYYGKNSTGEVYEDSKFDRYMQGAIDAGLDVGAYFFSSAVTVEEAIEEADLLLAKLEPYREHITYPVVCDWELLEGRASRVYGVDAKVITQCIDAFCRRVEEAGYTPMLYFNGYCGYLKMDLSKLTRYHFWYAEEADHPSCIYDFQFWQYSSSGKVAGIDSAVDMDLCFVPFGK